MPELTIRRDDPAPPPPVCMYCGAPGAVVREWQEENRSPRPGGGGGTDVVPAPGGDDPVSAVFGLLLLPFALWELVKGLVAATGAVVGWLTRPPVPAVPPPPPRPVKTTRVAVTACERHRRFTDRFRWAGLAMAAALVGLWVWTVLILRRDMGTDHVDLATGLTLVAVFATILLPLALAGWYTLAGPVIVERVTEDTVTLDRVRPAYFAATGLKPANE